MMSQILFSVLLLYRAADLTVAINNCFRLTSDIVFALDSSFSIRSQDYQRQLSFVKAVIDKFTIGHNHIQVGVVSFASIVRPDIRLHDFTNKRELKESVGKIEQLNGGTNTYEAIHFIRTVMFDVVNGGRPWSKKQLVLITDGLSSNSSATLLEASIAKSTGIEVFSILVGEGVEDLEIRGVASHPIEDHVFGVDNYKALMGIENALSSSTCHQPIADHHQVDRSIDDEYGPVPEAFIACERNVADIIFMMDSSSSIWEPDFQRQISFIQQVTSSFDIGKDAIQVSVVAYSDVPITLVNLSDKQTHEYIHVALSKAPYITGGTNTALAINHARKHILGNGNSRSYAAHVIIILSDGQSNDMKQTIDEARLAHEEGILIFAVGIGQKSEASELMALASDPDDQFVFHVNNYMALSEIKELLAIKTCDAAASIVTQDTFAPCPRLPTDLVFMYDTSALSHHHHDYVIRIISEVTKSKRLNSDLRVGVMREAVKESPLLHHDIELSHQWTQSNFKTQLDPDTHTASLDLLFRKARHKYFHPTFYLDHMSHKRTTVIFVDSQLGNPYGATVEALRLRRSRVKIVVVTIGKHINMTEVMRLASLPHNLYIIKSPTIQIYQMRDVVSKILSVLCE